MRLFCMSFAMASWIILLLLSRLVAVCCFWPMFACGIVVVVRRLLLSTLISDHRGDPFALKRFHHFRIVPCLLLLPRFCSILWRWPPDCEIYLVSILSRESMPIVSRWHADIINPGWPCWHSPSKVAWWYSCSNPLTLEWGNNDEELFITAEG